MWTCRGCALFLKQTLVPDVSLLCSFAIPVWARSQAAVLQYNCFQSFSVSPSSHCSSLVQSRRRMVITNWSLDTCIYRTRQQRQEDAREVTEVFYRYKVCVFPWNLVNSVELLWRSFCQYSSLNEPALYPQVKKSNGRTSRWSVVSVYVIFKWDVLFNFKATKVCTFYEQIKHVSLIVWEQIRIHLILVSSSSIPTSTLFTSQENASRTTLSEGPKFFQVW